MKQSKDPFEAAFEEQDESSPQISPSAVRHDIDIQTDEAAANRMANAAAAAAAADDDDDDYDGQEEDDDPNANITPHLIGGTSSSSVFPSSGSRVSIAPKMKEDDEEEEEENMDVELAKLPSNGDPDKMAKMQAILSQFTDEQMSRYESFRRAGFQKANMRRLLASITGTQKISVPLTIVVSGIAKMFVGDLVETARVVMTERMESGPIRPCHIREAYRRLKIEGKVPRRSVPRLFH